MYKLGAITIVILVIMTITAQFTKRAGYDEAIKEIFIINSNAHRIAMTAPWIEREYGDRVNGVIKVVAKAVVDRVSYNKDLRWDNLSIMMGGHGYVITVNSDTSHKFKQGDIIDVYIELAYELISLRRGETILSVSEMRVN